jgi:nifR3 family TIM-barrel protein
MFQHLMTRLQTGATPLYLAPQAGVSESPFRRLCRSFGADVVVSEFVSAEGIRRHDRRTHGYLRFHDDERPIGIQIFGADAGAMAEAAALVEQVYEPDYLDINFGCPVKKVVQRNGGSGCLREPELITKIIRAVIDATHLPVTVKTRSGWNEETRDPVSIALRMQEAGARAFTLHARTRTQMFSGRASWDEIARVVEALDIPVIGNGDGTQTISEYGFWEFRIWEALWPCLTLSMAAIAVEVAIRRRERGRNPLRCPTCGYDLRVTPTRCPECGTIPVQQQL